jgi:hypothetical protein
VEVKTMVKASGTRKSSNVKLEEGLSLSSLSIGLFLGIVGNLWVDTLFKMGETHFSLGWVIAFIVSSGALFGVGIWMWKTAMNLIRSSRIT